MGRSQGLRQGTFKKFDYGKQGNIDHYGQPDAPVYDLKKWPSSLPVALFCGALDWLADPTDVQILLSELPSVAYTHYEASTL
jgi:lysosomal acid lipase/cholesteryl ester hydrolase